MGKDSLPPSLEPRQPPLNYPLVQPPAYPPAAAPKCCGRNVSLCSSMSKTTLFTITAIVGVCLIVLGSMALAGHFAPPSATGYLQNLSTSANFVASQIGPDLFTLAMFATAIGAGSALTGIGGLVVEKCCQPPAQDNPPVLVYR